MNTNKIRAKRLPTGVAAMALVAVCFHGPLATPAFAQGPESGPPPMGGFEQGPGGPPPMGGFDQGGGGRRPQMMGRDRMGRGPWRPMPLSAATAPLDAISTALKLSGDQKQKIGAIQAQFQPQRSADRDAGPGPDGQGPDDRRPMMGGPSMDFQAGYATAKIEDVLTAGQRSQLSSLMDTLNGLRSVGIPPTLYASLKLTSDQTTRLLALAKTAGPPQDGGRPDGPPEDQGGRGDGGRRPPMRGPEFAQAQAILSTSQNAQLAAYRLSHPRPQRPDGGGPGGHGFRQADRHDDGMPPPPDDQGPPQPDSDVQHLPQPDPQ